MGLAFPIGLRLWTAGGTAGTRTFARRLGTFYSLNVGGGILGAVAAGFFLLPLLGSRSSLIALGSISFAGGLLLLAVSELRRPTQVASGLIASLDFRRLCDDLGRSVRAVPGAALPRPALIWHEEGVEATSAVVVSRVG